MGFWAESGCRGRLDLGDMEAGVVTKTGCTGLGGAADSNMIPLCAWPPTI